MAFTFDSQNDLNVNLNAVSAGSSGLIILAQAFAQGGAVLTPSNPINVIVWDAPFNCTATNVKGYVSGATGTTVNARRNGSLTLLVSDLTLGSADTWLDGGAVQNQAFTAGDKLEIMLTGIGGSPSQVAVQINFTRP